MADALDTLIGSWVTDPDDPRSLRTFGKVTVAFYSDGRMMYTVHRKYKDEHSLLNYNVEGNLLVTETEHALPGKPVEVKIERTPFAIDADGKLTVGEGEDAVRYVRKVKAPPPVFPGR